MFCSQCGKENEQGTKFCIQCGSQLQNVDKAVKEEISASDDKETVYYNGISSGAKALIIMAVILILVLIAGYNIFMVNVSTLKLDIKNEEIQANTETYVCETDDYLYYSGGDLYRADKTKLTTESVSLKDLEFICATKDAVCLADYNMNCYIMEDNASKLKKLAYIDMSEARNLFFDGGFYYTLSHSGMLKKRLNSEKYSAYSINLYEVPENWRVLLVKKYKNYLYMTISEVGGDVNEQTLIRVSLKNGKQEHVYNGKISDFLFIGDNIICSIIDGGFIRMNLKGNNIYEYAGISHINNSYMMCCDEYIYYDNNFNLYRFRVDDYTSEEIKSPRPYFLSATSFGLASIMGNELTLYDYSCNEAYVISIYNNEITEVTQTNIKASNRNETTEQDIDDKINSINKGLIFPSYSATTEYDGYTYELFNEAKESGYNQYKKSVIYRYTDSGDKEEWHVLDGRPGIKGIFNNGKFIYLHNDGNYDATMRLKRLDIKTLVNEELMVKDRLKGMFQYDDYIMVLCGDEIIRYDLSRKEKKSIIDADSIGDDCDLDEDSVFGCNDKIWMVVTYKKHFPDEVSESKVFSADLDGNNMTYSGISLSGFHNIASVNEKESTFTYNADVGQIDENRRVIFEKRTVSLSDENKSAVTDSSGNEQLTSDSNPLMFNMVEEFDSSGVKIVN